MKLGTCKDGHPDGALVVVDRALQTAVRVEDIAPTLQAALDAWAEVEPALRRVYDLLQRGDCPGAYALDTRTLMAPLPRAFQWLDGSAYVSHVELVRRARGAEMPPSFWTDPLMYQGGSDTMLGPHDDIELADAAWGLDFEAEVAVVTDATPMGVSAPDAVSHIKLLMLVNDVSLRHLVGPELAKGFGFLHSKPASAWSPVAVTPDELGNSWRDGKVHLPLRIERNGAWFGNPNAGVDMTFSFPDLVAHAARTRRLGPGTIVGSGTVSNRQAGVGAACVAEQRMREILAQGSPQTPFLAFGERVRIEMRDAQGRSVFGAIDQTVTCHTPAVAGV